MFRPVWCLISNSHFYILNNITYISIHFFTNTYFKKVQKSHLKLLYQTLPYYLGIKLELWVKLTSFEMSWTCLVLIKILSS